MATEDDINSTLQNIARQLGVQAQSQLNSMPNATTAASPVCYPINNLGTVATSVIGANQTRFGLVFHNPGTTTVYLYPTTMTTAPTTATLGGTFLVLPGGTLSFPAPYFANANCACAAFVLAGSNQSFTVVEFL